MEYDGTMLFVSHDRYFIHKMATAILYIDENEATFYKMNYQDYLDRNKAAKEIKTETKKTEVAEKKPQRNINYLKEVTKLEKKIAQKEEEIEALRELRFDPEYYHDYRKMNELDNQIDDVNNEIENLMALWEEYSEYLN